MLKTILIDDESAPIEIVRYFMKKYFADTVEVVDTARSADEAYQKINRYNPDFIFLDFNMPRGYGYDLLERFPVRDFDVIVMTAHPGYEKKAMEYGIAGFLHKPVEPDELIGCVRRLIECRTGARPD